MKCLCWKGKRCKVHPTKTEFELQYIASSPSKEHGGFHPRTVAAAKAALRLIRKLREMVGWSCLADCECGQEFIVEPTGDSK